RPARSLAIAAAVLAPVFLLTIAGYFATVGAGMEMAGQGAGGAQAEAEPYILGALGYGVVDMIGRVIGWLFAVVSNLAVYPIIIAILLGALAAKHRVLENPAAH